MEVGTGKSSTGVEDKVALSVVTPLSRRCTRVECVGGWTQTRRRDRRSGGRVWHFR